MERIVGLRRAVRARLHRALAEAAEGVGANGIGEGSGEGRERTRLPDEHHACVEGGKPRE